MKYKIGIIQERKTPPDSRVTLTPEQCRCKKHSLKSISKLLRVMTDVIRT